MSSTLFIPQLTALHMICQSMAKNCIVTLYTTNYVLGERKLKSSPSHVYEEIGDNKLRNNEANNNDSDSANTDTIGLHVNKSYDTVRDATIHLKECAAYSS